MMKVLMFAILVLPLGATNWYTCPGSVTSAGVYTVQADLTATTTPCIDISGISGYLEIDFNGHTLTGSANTGSTGAMYIHGNTGVVWWYGGTFTCAHADRGSLVKLVGNTGYDPARDGSGNSIWSTGNTYTCGGWMDVGSTTYFYTVGDTYTNSAVQVGGSSHYFVANSNTFTAGADEWPASIIVGGSSYPWILYNSITGNGLARFSGGNLDDGILLEDVDHANVEYNDITDVYDAGIEWTGYLTNSTITNNTITRPLVAGISCYHQGCTMTGTTIDSNTVTCNSSDPAALFITEVLGPGSSGGVFYNNYFTNNSIDNYAQDSVFGYPTDYGASFSVQVDNNHFGSGAYLYFSNGYAVGDGGGNYCAGVYGGSNLTCH